MRVVVALGGNALLRRDEPMTSDNQRTNVRRACDALAPVAAHEHLAEWSAVEAPTLLLRGEHGSVPERQVESMCALRPATELAVIAGAGHDLHLEAPDAMLPVLRRFLVEA